MGNTGVNAEHFYKTFEIIKIKEFWLDSIILGDLNKGVYSFKSPLSSYFKLFKFSKRISDIIKSKKIDSLYFGDINHPAYIFLSEKWQNQNKIYFFEEGLSHYKTPFFKKKYKNSRILKFKKFMTDRLIFKSLGVSNFSKYLQAVEGVDFDLRIDKKYNILPIKESEFEEIVEFCTIKSERLEQLIKSDLNFEKNKDDINILYISTSATSFFNSPLEDEIYVLNRIIRSIQSDFGNQNNINFFIKFHPKDLLQKKIFIRSSLTKLKINFIELAKESPYPVEVIFDEIHIDYLFGFGSSSQLYCEVLSPNTKNYNLFFTLSLLYNKGKELNNFPKNSWVKWQNLFFKIFNKYPLNYN